MHATRHIVHESELGRWETIYREPAPALCPYVTTYAAWDEDISGFQQRRELPSGVIPLLVSLGTPYRIGAPADRWDPRPYDAFVAGNHDTYATSAISGPQAGVQVGFTPPGARMLFGLPLHELTNCVFHLDDVLGADGRRLAEQLRAAPSWDACFDILDDAFIARMAAALPLNEGIAWAYAQACNAPVNVGALAHALGISHRSLILGFRDHIGLTPRTTMRIARFSRALAAIAGDPQVSLASLAADCGYYDQPHLYRDFRQFAGITPAGYLRSLAPDNGGLIAG